MAKSKEQRRTNFDEIAKSFNKSYGENMAVRGGLQRPLKSIPSGSLALDYAMTTGGWPIGYVHGVFGPRDIGKSSMIGLNAVKNAQAMDLACVWIALEAFNEAWAEKNGVDVEDLLVLYPETGEEAFGMLHKLLREKWIDLIIFDSIGSVLVESEMQDGGTQRMGGASNLISFGARKAAILAQKNETCVILLNQVRVDMQARFLAYVQPGGKALEHSQQIILQLKNGKEKYTVKQDGQDIIIGREIVAQLMRSKSTEGSGHKATFDYYFAEVPGYPFGIDKFTDTLNTAKRTGVIVQRGSMYDLPNGQSLKGAKAVEEYLNENPEVFDEIRERVLEVMVERNKKTVLHPTTEEDGE